MNPMNDFEYFLNELFGKPIPKDTSTKRVNKIINDMENNNLGSVDRVNLKNKSVYFKADSSTLRREIIPFTKNLRDMGWILYVRWQ